jgi:hypothetical protein
MENSIPRLPEPIAFRFFADFNIKVQPKETAGFTTEQSALLRTIATCPAILRRIARMRLETDLSGITDCHLSDLFSGPAMEDILECVLPFLSESERSYWGELRDGPDDSLHNELMPFF